MMCSKNTIKKMFKPGSKYIHFTKYGGINKGEVKSYGETHVVDTKNCVTYLKPHIITTKNILLKLDGSNGTIFKVEKEYTIEEAKKLSMTIEKMVEYKHKKMQEHRDGVEL
jgi:hypothetical protein